MNGLLENQTIVYTLNGEKGKDQFVMYIPIFSFLLLSFCSVNIYSIPFNYVRDLRKNFVLLINNKVE